MTITKEKLHELFEYRDGWLYHKTNRGTSVKIGQRAGHQRCRGYWGVNIDRRYYKMHRLIFLMHHGYLPPQVDHIDRDRGNNRIENLRAATQNNNQHNRTKRIDNTSGFKGVCWSKQAKKWKAQITFESKNYCLGLYDDIEEAAKAYRAAALRLHGEFARF